MSKGPFSSQHTLDVEHRRRVLNLRRQADAAAAQVRLEDMSSPDIAVRLAARAAAAAARPVKQRIDEELAYMRDAGPILMRYYDIQATAAEPPSVTAASKDSILRYFLPEAPADAGDDRDGAKTQLLRDYERATKAVDVASEPADCRCRDCGAPNMLLVAEEAVRVCRQCCACEHVVVETERPPSKDTVKDSTTFCYKRNTHFTEWLNQIQGKQQANIPEDVYGSILLELHKRKRTNLKDLGANEVKEILRKGKNQRWYEHTAFILSKLTGRDPLQIHPELEERLRSMFRQIQAPFVKHAPRSRTNFLSYSYVLHKLLLLLGHVEYLSSLTLLKSADKLKQQDSIWKNICRDLSWEFTPSL